MLRGSAIVAALVGTPCAAQPLAGSAYVNDVAYIERLNSAPDSTWVAARQDIFEGVTADEARVLLGTKLSHISKHINATLPDSVYAAIADDDLPTDFDSHTQWPGLVHDIRDQKACGSCWAISASEVLSDRVAIATGKSSAVLSVEDMVSCDRKDQGCNGGSLPTAWEYLTGTGLVTDSCFPYTAGGGKPATCRHKKCKDDEAFVRTKAKSAYAISSPVNMQKDIFTHGPIQVGFKVYSSFQLYKSGVYHKHIWEILPEGGHAVKILGWGVAKGVGIFKKDVNYWTVANSWGPKWGEEGFFRIVRDKNECGIEDMGPPYAGLADTGRTDDLIVI